MSGRFIFEKESKNFNKVHNRVIFYLGKEKLIYNDIRRFGWLKVIKEDELKDLLKNLGTDALEISFEEFEKIVKNSSRMIKGLLIDQTKISGIGNIYANEILYLALINPKTKANNLTTKQLKDLYGAITKVLKRALKFNGSSISSFITSEAQKGNYQEHF
jgi:formamidopyrimidine-DNA glycosylase